MLYPQTNQERNVYSLDGIWNFRPVKTGEMPDVLKPISREEAFAMPVPCAYNDLYPGKEMREHAGDLLYQRSFAVNKSMLSARLVLRFGSVTHGAKVYLNGELVCEHLGGFMPFECEIADKANLGDNLLHVVVNNLVTYETVPCGRMTESIDADGNKRPVNLPNFDFFNYSGIMRPVCLYTTGKTYINDITAVARANGNLSWKVDVQGPDVATISIALLDADNQVLAEGEGAEGELAVADPELWSTENPYLYRLKVSLKKDDGILDEYVEKIGFRDFEVKNNQILLNGEPVYLTGFGKHEDYPVNGRGFNEAYNVKDLALMKWMGANSFRTSHYPYSEEMMRLCDREGILVINEVAAVGLNNGFTATGLLGGDASGTWTVMKTEAQHRQAIEELVRRDKNHPCVIMWSVANEPASQDPGAKDYFSPMFDLFRKLDPQKRPVTLVTYDGASPQTCEITELCDVICINRYYGWYSQEEDLIAARAELKKVFEDYHKRCPDKPIMLTEYGADTVAGMHDINAGLFSEEFQKEFLSMYGEVFDSYPYICGEHVWNFADFATAANIKRVQGNKKGVFTRERQPKWAAWFLRDRWTKLKKY